MDDIFSLLSRGLNNFSKYPKISMEKDTNGSFINIENTIFLFEDKNDSSNIIKLEYVDKDTNEFLEICNFKSDHEIDIIIKTLECYFKFFILSSIEEDYWTMKND